MALSREEASQIGKSAAEKRLKTPPGHLMEGVIARLETFNEKGEAVDSEIVFEPVCDWYMGKLRDYLACTKYEDIGAVIDEFGLDVAKQVLEGQVVAVERVLSDEEITEKDLRQVRCWKPFTIEKKQSPIRYPWPGGSKEYLVKRWE